MEQKSHKAGVQRVILLATDLSDGGGVNRVIRELAILLKRQLGFDVTVVNARSDRAPAYEFPADIPVQPHRPQSLLSYFLLLIRLRRARADFVISSWTQDNILVTLALLFSRTKVVLVEHASWHFSRRGVRALRRITYPFASQVVVLNPRDLDHYRRFLSKVRLIPNPVTANCALDAFPREKLILAIGHLEPLKRLDHAIKAMAESGLESDGWSMLVVGSGSQAATLNALITELGLKRTKIVPPMGDLASLYDRASLLLVTSRLESFSLVLAEGMLAGVVPIAYDSDGPAFILQDFPDHLVESGNLPQLRDRLLHFARRNDVASLRGDLASSIQARSSTDVVARQWQDVLHPGYD